MTAGTKDIIMPPDNTEKNPKGKLKASIKKGYKMDAVNFFADYTGTGRDLYAASERINSLSDVLVFLSSSPPCPSCGQSKLMQSERWNPKEWFLKFFGRRVFHCSNCGWKITLKLHRWEWETIITALAVLAVLIIYSIHWFWTGK